MPTVSELMSQNIGNTLTNVQTWSSVLYNVKSYGAKGDGTTDDATKIADAITAASASGGIVYFPPGTYIVGSALTFPSNVTVEFSNGAKLSVNTGITVTINGPINAGLYQIFSGVGTVAGTPKVDAFYPQWWGAKGDGATDDATAIQKALAILNQGKTLFFPPGKYLCGTQLTTNGINAAILGAGLNQSRIVFTSASGGFSFTLNAQEVNTPPQQLVISDLAIESRAAVTSPAINATWSTYQANAQGQLWISRVQITRKDDGTGSFSKGIALKNCFVGVVEDSIILGDDLRVSSVGIYLEDCVSIRIKETDINRYATGVQVRAVSSAQSEGVLLQNCSVYDVNIGVDVINAIGINLLGTHVNINGTNAQYSVKLDNVKQSTIDSCLIYAGGNVGDSANQDAVQILNGSTSILINNTDFLAVTAANTRTAILTSGGVSYCMFKGNTFNFFPTGVSFPTVNDTLNHVTNNLFFTVTTPITDLGTNNFLSDNTSNGNAINNLRWGTSAGKFGVGELSVNANWGAYIRGRNGTSADVALADSNNNVAAYVIQGAFFVKSYAKASLPSATIAGGLIYVSDDIGGAVIAFSDGTNWRRVTDRAIIS